jgi:hypothetical protein
VAEERERVAEERAELAEERETLVRRRERRTEVSRSALSAWRHGNRPPTDASG